MNDLEYHFVIYTETNYNFHRNFYWKLFSTNTFNLTSYRVATRDAKSSLNAQNIHQIEFLLTKALQFYLCLVFSKAKLKNLKRFKMGLN